MSNFLVKVFYKHGNPAEDIGVLINYGWLGGCEEKRTNSDGCIKFHNRGNIPGNITVQGHSMGNHSLTEGETYLFTI